MNFTIQPEFFYTNKERIQIMIKYKENEFFNSKVCSRWSLLHGVIEFREFHDNYLELPNIYNILSITVQLKYDGDYFVYYFKNQDEEPLINLGKENKLTILMDFYPRLVLNNMTIPYDEKMSTQSQELDVDDDCIIL